MQAFYDRVRTLVRLNQRDSAELETLPWSSKKVGKYRDFVSAGDQPDFAFVVISGWAARYSLKKDGTRRITSLMLPGDFCGIHAVCGARMDHGIMTLTPCDFGRIQRQDIQQAAKVAPGIADALWRAKLIDESILRMWLLNHDDALHALSHLLCELHARASAINIVQEGRFHAPLTQVHLGDALGLTAVHVNRQLKLLREAGLAEISSGEVSVPNISALRQSCSFDPSYLHASVSG